jgi:hypothetical protein
MTKTLFTITVKSVSHQNNKESVIVLGSDSSEIRIPLQPMNGRLVGLVPHDAPGHWTTLRGKKCVFVVGKIPDWW